MNTHFNEDLIPSYELTYEETKQLLETGFLETDDGFCITYNPEFKEFKIYKEFDEYDGLTLNKEAL